MRRARYLRLDMMRFGLDWADVVGRALGERVDYASPAVPVLERLVQEATDDYGQPVLAPVVGDRYIVSVWEPEREVSFVACLASISLEVDEDNLTFVFDNGVELTGNPTPLPPGWVLDDDVYGWFLHGPPEEDEDEDEPAPPPDQGQP